MKKSKTVSAVSSGPGNGHSGAELLEVVELWRRSGPLHVEFVVSVRMPRFREPVSVIVWGGLYFTLCQSEDGASRRYVEGIPWIVTPGSEIQ